MSKNPSAGSALSAAAGNATPVKPRKWRRLLKISLSLLALLLLFVLLLPTIISSGPGTSFALSFVNGAIPGKIEVSDLSVGWFSGTRVEGFALKDPDGKTIVAGNIAAPDVALLAVATGNFDLGAVTISAQSCDIVQYADGSTNLDRAFGPSKPRPKDDRPTSIPASLAGIVKLTVAKATFTRPNMAPATVSDLVADATLTSPQSITAKLRAGLAQDGKNATLAVDARVKDLFDSEGLLQLKRGTLDVTVDVDGQLGQIADALAKLDEKIATVAGPTMATKVTVNGKVTNLTTLVTVKAERLAVQVDATTLLDDDLKPKALQLNMGAAGKPVVLTITDASRAKLVKNAGGTLRQPVTITVVQEGDILVPLTGGKVDFKSALAKLRIDATPIAIDTGEPDKPDVKTLEIKAFSVQYDGPRGKATALIDVVAAQGAHSGNLIVKADLSDPFNAQGQVAYETLKAEVSAEMKGFALGVVDEIIGQRGLLAGTLGAKLNTTVAMNLSPRVGGNGADGTWEVVASTADKLKVNIKGSLAADRAADGSYKAFARLAEPGTIELKRMQETLDALASRFEGLKPLAQKLKARNASGVTVTLTKFAAPLVGALAQKAVAELAVNIGAFDVDLNKEKEAKPDLLVTVDGINVALAYSGQENKAKATLTATTMAAGQAGAHSVTADIANIFGADGRFNAKGLSPAVDAKLNNLPMALADAVGGTGEVARTSVGKTIDVQLTSQPQQITGKDGKPAIVGPVTLTATGENLNVIINAELADGAVRLRDQQSGLNLRAQPALVKALISAGILKLPENLKDLTLAQMATLDVRLTTLALPLDPKKVREGTFGIIATIDQLTPIGDPRLQGAAIRNIRLELPGTSLKETLKLSLKADLQHKTQQGAINVTASVDNLFDADGRVDTARLAPVINAVIDKLPMTIVDAFAGKGTLASISVGPDFSATIAALPKRVALPDGKTDFAGPVTITIQSANLNGALNAELAGGRLRTTDDKGNFAARLTRESFEALKASGIEIPEDYRKLTLEQDTTATMAITKFDLPLDKTQLKSGIIGMTLTVDQVVPSGDVRIAGASLRNLVVSVPPVRLDQQVIATIRADLLQGGTKGNLSGDATITGILEEKKQVRADLRVADVPVGLVDALGGQGGFLRDLFGDSIRLIAVNVNQGGGDAMAATLKADSLPLTADVAVEIVSPAGRNRRIVTRPRSTFTITLTREGLKAIQDKFGDKLPQQLRNIDLVDATVATVVVDTADLELAPAVPKAVASAAPPAPPSPAAPTVTAPAATGDKPAAPPAPLPLVAAGSRLKLTITSKGPFFSPKSPDEALRLDDLTLHLATPASFTELALDLSAKTVTVPIVAGRPDLAAASSPNALRGTIATRTTLHNLVDDKGRVTFANVSRLDNLASDTQIRMLPITTLDKTLGKNGQWVGYLGTRLDELTLLSRKAGDVEVKLLSTKEAPEAGQPRQVQADVNLLARYGDTITLQRDGVIQLRMNDMISEGFFEPLTGGMLSVQSSEKPVVIKLLKDGFSATPDLDVKKMAGKIDIDFGNMKIKPRVSIGALGGDSGKALALTGIGNILESELNSALTRMERYTPSFGPFSATIKNGILTYDKPMVFTADKYTFAIDGHINLNTNTPNLRMAFPKQMFPASVQKFLGSEGYLGVPFTGSFSAPKLDTAAFAKELVTSLASGGGASKIPGGDLLGGIFGGNKPKEPVKPEPAPPKPADPVSPQPQNPDPKKPAIPGIPIDPLKPAPKPADPPKVDPLPTKPSVNDPKKPVPFEPPKPVDPPKPAPKSVDPPKPVPVDPPKPAPKPVDPPKPAPKPADPVKTVPAPTPQPVKPGGLTIKQIMEKAHKGEPSLAAKAMGGKASEQELADLLDMYQQLSSLKPPKGTDASWKRKTEALIESVERLQKGQIAARTLLKNATNCKTCHNVHQAEEK